MKKHKKSPADKKSMTMHNLSIVIAGRGTKELREDCINECLRLSRNIFYYTDPDSINTNIDTLKRNSIIAVTDINELDERCTAPWVLLLNSDEKPVIQGGFSIDKILTDHSSKGYSLLVKKPYEQGVLNSFQWLSMNNQYKNLTNNLTTQRIEIRLVHNDYFRRFLRYFTGELTDETFSWNSKILKGLEVVPCYDEAHQNLTESESDISNERKYLTGEKTFNPDETDEMPELSDDYIIYSVLTQKDVERYYRGLEKGFGSERMYLTFIHYLGQFGRFEEARDFFEAWHETWGFFDTQNPYKLAGIIYANLLDFDTAVSFLEQYMNSEYGGVAKDIKSLLGKVYFLQGKYDKAEDLLKCSLENEYNKFDDLILQSLEQGNRQSTTLSVCMIARDEAEYIEKALASVLPVADEIIVVDTGSTDNTIEIAESYGARVIESPWDNDFSKARNTALEAASGDYILCLDADEFIDPRQKIQLAIAKRLLPADGDTAFRILVEEEDHDEETAVMLRLPRSTSTQYPVRLFPAKKNLYFEGNAFEGIERSSRAVGIKPLQNDIFKITHAKSDRIGRNLRKEMSVRAMQDEPIDRNRAMQGTVFFLSIGDPQTALQWFEKTDVDNPALLAKIMTLYSLLGVTENVRAVIDTFLQRFPQTLELTLADAEINFALGEYEKVCQSLDGQLAPMTASLSRVDVAKAHYIHGMSLIERGDLDNGINNVIKAREEDPWNVRFKLGGIYAMITCGAWDDAVQSLTDILNDEKLNLSLTLDDFADLAYLFHVLRGHYHEQNRHEAILICEKIIQTIIDNHISRRSEIEKISNFLNESYTITEASTYA